MNPVRRWFLELSPGRRLVVGAASVVLGVLVLVQAVQSTVGGSAPSGPSSSSLATSKNGLAAYASLLARSGSAVTQRRLPLGDGLPVTPGAALFVLGAPELDDRESAAVRRFVDDGGQLIAGGVESTLWINRIFSLEMESVPLASNGSKGASLVDAGSPARRISTPSGIGFDPEHLPVGSVALALSADIPVAVSLPERSGSLVLLSDVSMLDNSQLAQRDNAAFGLGLPDGRPVVFAESVHGFGPRGGLRGLPERWRWSLGFMLAATLAWMLSRARRNGPPEVPVRDLPPARREYVDALGVTLARVRRRGGSTGTVPDPREDTDR